MTGPPHLVDHISEGQVGDGHAGIAAQRHVDGVVVGAEHQVVQVDQVGHGLQTSYRGQQTEWKLQDQHKQQQQLHPPSSFMARRYSSSKDSFITAQTAWQI